MPSRKSPGNEPEQKLTEVVSKGTHCSDCHLSETILARDVCVTVPRHDTKLVGQSDLGRNDSKVSNRVRGQETSDRGWRHRVTKGACHAKGGKKTARCLRPCRYQGDGITFAHQLEYNGYAPAG